MQQVVSSFHVSPDSFEKEGVFIYPKHKFRKKVYAMITNGI